MQTDFQLLDLQFPVLPDILYYRWKRCPGGKLVFSRLQGFDHSFKLIPDGLGSRSTQSIILHLQSLLNLQLQVVEEVAQLLQHDLLRFVYGLGVVRDVAVRRVVVLHHWHKVRAIAVPLLAERY